MHFSLEARHDASTVIVVINVRDTTVGVVVDAVSDAISLTSQHIKPAPALGEMARVDHIIGIAVVGRDAVPRMFILLDIQHLISEATLQAELNLPSV